MRPEITILPPKHPTSSGRIERMSGGLYFQIDGGVPACMFTEGNEQVIVKLSRDDARILAEWLAGKIARG